MVNASSSQGVCPEEWLEALRGCKSEQQAQPGVRAFADQLQ